jgi:hypothetical protein
VAGSLILSNVAARTPVLNIGCDRCDRVGRYSLDTLIERYGAAFTIPTLLRELSADCPKRVAATVYDICGVHCPDLPAQFPVSR